MQRVYVVIDDEEFHRMNEAVDETGKSRAQWIGEAISEKLQRRDSGPALDVMKLNDEVMKLRDENKRLNDELVHHKQLLATQRDERNDETIKLRDELTKLRDEQTQQLTYLNDELAMKSDEIDRLKNQLNQATSEATQRWEELKEFRVDNSKQKKDLEDARVSNQKLKGELTSAVVKAEQAGAEVEVSRIKLENYLSALRVKDDEIAFLRGHVSQLSEKITPALPPSQEEAKAKSWWRFWW